LAAKNATDALRADVFAMREEELIVSAAVGERSVDPDEELTVLDGVARFEELEMLPESASGSELVVIAAATTFEGLELAVVRALDPSDSVADALADICDASEESEPSE